MSRQPVPRERDARFGPGADDAGCPILHVDMDAFYASVELRRRPELRGRPVIVGGLGPRGVVSAASYEARTFGVRSAMPMARARRACPQGVYLPPDFTEYSAVSKLVMAMFRDVTPLVEQLSVDEAFLDVSGAVRLFGSPGAIAQRLRARVAGELGLTCSVGVAQNKFLAKLASTRAKPDGLLIVPRALMLDFLHPLPVGALWGVGERTAEVLRRLGLTLVRDVANAPPASLRSALGEAAGRHVHELSWGRDERRVTTRAAEKSIGAETTFDVDVTDPDQLRRALLGLAQQSTRRLRSAALTGRTVALKVRYDDFTTVSRSRTLAVATDVTREVFETVWGLYETLRATQGARPVRLIGVRIESLVEAAGTPRQLTLGEPEHGWREADQAADAVTARFGSAAIRPASLLRPREDPGTAASSA
ncbi:DNA polymerase IV [Longispora albida]|uniref:DNA polymerase IV n=1 Tax=Longispora albida TaxID=203523 RepID=UPI0003731D7B|nr:DNA polymerase IV [Longispora albida]